MIVSVFAFAPRVLVAPIFPDETAYVSQSYYFDLFAHGDWDNWAWVEYHAYDLPPLPKYVFGAALRGAGYDLPDRLTAGAWFANIRRSLVPAERIHVARWPVVAFGILGCWAIYALGTTALGQGVGMVAALLLALNPLYGLHAHRAMSDVPAECFILLAGATGVVVWKGLLAQRIDAVPMFVLTLLLGVWCGLAALCKLNGLLAWMVFAAACGLGVVLARGRRRTLAAFIGSATCAAIAGVVVFIVLNPYMLARPRGPIPPMLMAPAPIAQTPLERGAWMIRHRVEVSHAARARFPHEALLTPFEKLAAVSVQGFGRFGPLGPRDHDSTVPYARFDMRRDWGALIWLPCVLAGAVVLVFRGRGQCKAGSVPLAWFVVLFALVSASVVTGFIPMAWDRYYLSLQAPAALLGASTLVALARVVSARFSSARAAS